MQGESGSKRFFGIYRGTVTNVNDPENKKRVKARIPQILGNEPTDWMWCSDYSAQSAVAPGIGQGIWVMFEGGDPSFPVWVGTFGQHKSAGRQVNIRPLPAGTYPSTVKIRSTGRGTKELDLIGTIIAIAKTVEDIRLSLNAHGGGDSESPPTRVQNY